MNDNEELNSRIQDSVDQLYIENNVVKIKKPSIHDPMIKKIANILQALIDRKDIAWSYNDKGEITLKYVGVGQAG